MGCLLAPFSFLKWAFTNGWKGIIVLIVVLIMVVVGFFVIKGKVDESMKNDSKPAVTATVQPGVPSNKTAPFLVRTWSRNYYAVKAVQDKDGSVTMTGYWESINGKWVERKGVLDLDPTFGKITIQKR